MVLAAVGGLLLLQGTWIPAKAALAQVLLERAWARTRAGAPAPRPWPWADTTPLARLEVPARGVTRVVLAGATGRVLAFGPGHLAGSARPGTRGNSVLAGHRDTHFAFLRDLAPGDRITVERADGGRMDYTVVRGAVVHERDPGPLAPTGPTRLTLITCFPFDTPVPGGPLRWVVTAEARPVPSPVRHANGTPGPRQTPNEPLR